MDEFELIERYFSGFAADSSVSVGIGDDGAVVRPEPGRDLVAVVDTLVEAVHFPADLNARDLGFRAVQVNLSDVSAMGARPRWMTLALTLSDADDHWLAGFAEGLRDAAVPHGVALIGGDTTRGSSRVVTVQVIGDSDPRTVLRRSGAWVGDDVYVSGWPGEAAAGLTLLTSGHSAEGAAGRLMQRFSRPEARVALGQRIAGLASAAIDVSDGLAGDLSKLLAASGCGAELNLDAVPLSPDLEAVVGSESARRLALEGGDDYELCFTAALEHRDTIAQTADELGLPISRIGEVVAGRGIEARLAGRAVSIDSRGYRHFGGGS